MARAKICNHPGCNELISHDKRYCEKHIRAPRVPFENAVRSNDSLYNTTRWRKLRRKVLKENKTCFNCGTNNNLEVHHRVPPRGNEEAFYDECNLIPLCSQCHRVVTAHEIKKRSR